MATGEFLRHHLHPRLPFHLAESRYLHPRSLALNGLPFSLPRSAATLPKRKLLPPSIRSVRCMKQEEHAGGVQIGASEAQPVASDGSNTEAAEWVKKAAPDPMVEVDPVTVFRRIVAERRASLALARAKEEAYLASQATSPPPIVLGRKWPDNSAVAIATALVLLAVAAALYFFRSREGLDKATELTSTDGKDNFESSINGRRKLVKDTVKASDSILTAMALGAASVSRAKVHIGSSHDTPDAANGNAVESLIQGELNSNLILNSVATEDLKSDLHGSATDGQMPYSSSIVEDYAPLKTGYDVTEGPWFGQVADDTEKPVPAEVVEKLEFDDAQSQGLRFSNETTAEQLVSEFSVAEARFESPALTSVIHGEFCGEVVSVNVATVQVMEPNYGRVQVDNAMFEESESDSDLADSSTIPEELEQGIEQDLMEGKNATDETICPEQNLVTGSSVLDLSYVQSDVTDSDSDVDESHEHPSDSKVQMGQIEDSAAIAGNHIDEVSETGEEPSTEDHAVATFSPSDEASEEISRQESKKALQQAIPAIAIGVGTVGALFGVAGGLQVVGFAALANFISHDVFWARSRESLLRELNGITDRQNLFDFLARRNIMRNEQENSSL